MQHAPHRFPDLIWLNDDDLVPVRSEERVHLHVGAAVDEEELAVLEGRVLPDELPLNLRIHFVLGRVDELGPDIIDRLRLHGEIDVPRFHVLHVRHADDLLKTGVDVDGRVYVGYVVHVLHLALHAVEGVVVDQVRVEGVLIVPDRIAEEEPAVVVLPELVGVDRNLGVRLPGVLELPVSESDYLPAGDGGIEVPKEVFRNLEHVIPCKRDDGALLFARRHVQPLLEVLQPLEVLKSLELAEAAKGFAEDVLLVGRELLIEERGRLVLVADRPPPALSANHLLAEGRLLESLDVLLDHPRGDLGALEGDRLLDVLGGIVLMGVGQHPVDDAVAGHGVFVYRHGIVW